MISCYNLGVIFLDFIVDSVEKTMEIGRKIGELARSGDVICLIGDLGTGKTHITKGIAEGLGIKEYITSPTFTIVNEYFGRLKLNHFDVYRVNDPDEIYDIGFDEYIFSESLSIIEWANYIEELIPKEHIRIIIDKLPKLGENYRKISIEGYGSRYNYLKEIML
jgi:tRNA threonylcarbamoyladenosine biosynthesis protein TsaE